MGITEVIRHAPYIYRQYRKLVSSIEQRRPDVAVLIDFPDVNFRLARELHKRGVLVDGKKGALLLQIFSENQLGPIFFEFIQRKGDDGFGEGNFKALFESIELDQIRRGAIKA